MSQTALWIGGTLLLLLVSVPLIRRRNRRNAAARDLAKQRAAEARATEVSELEAEIDGLMDKLRGPEGLAEARRLLEHDHKYDTSHHYRRYQVLERRARNLELDESFFAKINEAEEFARDLTTLADRREAKTKWYHKYRDAETLPDRIDALIKLRHELSCSREYVLEQLSLEWDNFDTNDEAMQELLHNLVRKQFAALVDGLTDEAGVRAMFAFYQQWGNRNIEGISLPADWRTLLAKYVVKPTYEMYFVSGELKFPTGDLRAHAVQAIRGNDLIEIVFILALVNNFTGNREDVGELIVAGLEFKRRELHEQEYPDLYSA